MTSRPLMKAPDTEATVVDSVPSSALRLHLPLIKVTLAAISAYATALWVHLQMGEALPLSWRAFFWFAGGLLYTHFFEYFYHKVAMHGRIRGFTDRRHLEHHRIFLGDNFQSRNSADLLEVTTEWYIYPALLLIHYLTFLAILPAQAAPAFFLGATCQFLAYEGTHWFTHVGDNAFDKLLGKLPILGAVRASQIKHHQIHHARPAVNFNFTPPYGGDRLCGTHSREERPAKPAA